MSGTVTVNAPEGTNPTVYPCVVGTTPVSVVASAQALALVPEAEQDTYVQARALLATDDAAAATVIVTPLATGSAPPSPQTNPPTPDTRNWAALWIAGQIPS